MGDPPDIAFDGELVAERYRLGPVLGRGSQGTTYVALDTETGQSVAIKAFDLSKVENWKGFELFQRECRVLQELDYSAIPAYLEDFEDEETGRFYLVMEYVPGRSLAEVLRGSGPLGEEQLWEVFYQVAETLAYLHRRVPPIVHRDVKPSNLIRNSHGDITLVDFGGVRDAFRPEGGSTVVGTFGYMAPEQLHGQAVPATDLFALGASLLHLGTGVEPEKLPRKGLRIDVEKGLEGSKELTALLRRMTEPDPDDRPRSAVELLEEVTNGELPFNWGDDDAPAGRRSGDTLDLPTVDPPLPALPSATPWPLVVAVGAALWAFGLAGRVALKGVELVLVPLVFAILVALSSDRSASTNLREREASFKATLRSGGDFLRRLSAHGRNEIRRHRRRGDPDSARRPAELREHQRRIRAHRRRQRRGHRRRAQSRSSERR